MDTRSSIYGLVAFAACFGVACSDGTGTNQNATSTFDTQFATSGWQRELPTNTSPPTYGDTVAAQGCTFTIGTTVQMPPFPPQYLAIVKRSGNMMHCHPGYVVLGSSYAIPFVAIASGHGGLVADYTSKSTPSGEAHVQLFIVELEPSSGVFVRHASIAAMSPDAYHPEQGNVWTGALRIDPSGTLVVTGDKNGIIPNESGVGWHYIAIFDHFLHAKTDNPTPSSVVAFNAL